MNVDNGFGDFNPLFVFAAYAIVWIIFFGYLYYMARRQADIQSQIDSLQESMPNSNEGAEEDDASQPSE